MYNAWLRSGIYGSASYVYLLYSSGALTNALANTRHAVRPALHSTAVNFLKKAADIPCFWDYRSFV